jgi:cell division protein FtsB
MRSIARPGFKRKLSSRQPVWNALNRLIVFLIFVVVGTVLFFFFQPELSKLSDMQRRVAELEATKERITIEQLRLEREKTLLATEPEYLENIARDKLDLMKPGETIFRLDARTGATPISSAP